MLAAWCCCLRHRCPARTLRMAIRAGAWRPSHPAPGSCFFRGRASGDLPCYTTLASSSGGWAVESSGKLFQLQEGLQKTAAATQIPYALMFLLWLLSASSLSLHGGLYAGGRGGAVPTSV